MSLGEMNMAKANKNPCTNAGMPEPALYTQKQLDAAVAAEREACAKVCEAKADMQDSAWRHGLTPTNGDLADMCAADIRARSTEESK